MTAEETLLIDSFMGLEKQINYNDELSSGNGLTKRCVLLKSQNLSGVSMTALLIG